MVVNEFIYETREALMELCTFLHDQSDQIDRIIIKSQDENLHYIFGDPSNGLYMPMHDAAECIIGDVAVGMMYRVINTRRLFELLGGKCFGDGKLKVKLKVKDDLLEENNGSLILHFSGGKVKISQKEDYEVEVNTDIGSLSSMLMGAVSFSRLYSLGLAEISNVEYIEKVSRLFALDTKPMCTSTF
jgi:predicted acetyltransferase